MIGFSSNGFAALVGCTAVFIGGLAPESRAQDVPLEGFIPFVGIAMTDEQKDLDALDLGGIPFIADTATSVGAPLLGDGSPFFDLALFDSGAATHIITQDAFNGFDLQGAGLEGINTQAIGGATGVILTVINDAAGIYAAGLGDRTSAGTTLEMDSSALRGQTSIATLTAPEEWTLPNILGLPMAAQHAIAIRNDDPQIFQHQGRTVRTPQIDFIDLGSGVDEGITRRLPLNLKPGIGFVQGPQYIYNLDLNDILAGGDIDLANNPASPSVVIDSNGVGGGLFVDVNMADGADGFEEREFLFDTGASLTVISEQTAVRLGFDPVQDTPEFLLEVEGSGGVQGGVPGFYVDELSFDTIGGSFVMHNVPVAVLDVANPNDPGNIIEGIIGMNLFNGRNLVIDANPATGQGGVGPSVFISDPVTAEHQWASTSSDDAWEQSGSWSAAGVPDILGDAQVRNVSGSSQRAVVSSDSTVFRMTVGSDNSADIAVIIEQGATLTTFGEALIETGGAVFLAGGKIDAQFINITGGELAGSGDVFVGVGPVNGAVRNLSGRVSPEGIDSAVGQINIVGDLANASEGTLAFDLGGTTAVSEYDQITTDRFAFLAGTLEVSLVGLTNGVFVPSVGNLFTLITAGEGIEGQFDSLDLPAGFLWDVQYNASSVVLEVTGIGLQGDFNSDGLVDAADYAVWRAGLGTAYTAADYDLWRQNFGASVGVGAGGAASTPSVPEPTAVGCLLVLLAWGVKGSARWRR